ncbi:MAG: ATP-binding cassette domain-containing protein [Candidatus Solibacter sp.]
MPQPLLRIKLSAGYPGKPGVLTDLELAIDEGEIVGLVGQSGSGKSTLGMAIPRLLDAAARVGGEVLFRGENLLACSEARMRSLRGKDIGVVFQGASSALNPALRIGSQPYVTGLPFCATAASWKQVLPRLSSLHRAILTRARCSPPFRRACHARSPDDTVNPA